MQLPGRRFCKPYSQPSRRVTFMQTASREPAAQFCVTRRERGLLAGPTDSLDRASAEMATVRSLCWRASVPLLVHSRGAGQTRYRQVCLLAERAMLQLSESDCQL